MKGLEIYQTDFKYYLTYVTLDGTYNGRIHLADGVHGTLEYKYVEFIEWEGDSPNAFKTEEIEDYLDDNLIELVIDSEKI